MKIPKEYSRAIGEKFDTNNCNKTEENASNDSVFTKNNAKNGLVIYGETIPNSSDYDDYSSFESITVLEGVAVIIEDMFTNCNLVRNVIIPKSVGLIVNGAFSRCNTIVNITFGGTKDQCA